MKPIVYILSLCTLITSCAHSHKIFLEESESLEMVVTVYDRKMSYEYGPYVELRRMSYEIPAGSAKHEKILSWLNTNRDGWHYQIATLVPGNITIEGKNFDLNLEESRAMLFYKDRKGRQYLLYKEINKESYNFLLKDL